MDVGRMDRRLQIQELQPQLDAAGQSIEKFVTTSTVWAEVVPLRGNEAFVSAQRFSTATHRFRIRWIAGLTTRHRILFEDRAYDVLEILELGRREGLDVTATASPGTQVDAS